MYTYISIIAFTTYYDCGVCIYDLHRRGDDWFLGDEVINKADLLNRLLSKYYRISLEMWDEENNILDVADYVEGKLDHITYKVNVW